MVPSIVNDQIVLFQLTLTDTTTPGQSGSGSKAMKRYFRFLKVLRLEPHYQMDKYHIRTLDGVGSFSPQQR